MKIGEKYHSSLVFVSESVNLTQAHIIEYFHIIEKDSAPGLEVKILQQCFRADFLQKSTLLKSLLTHLRWMDRVICVIRLVEENLGYKLPESGYPEVYSSNGKGVKLTKKVVCRMGPTY